jgi:hypothetical protein
MELCKAGKAGSLPLEWCLVRLATAIPANTRVGVEVTDWQIHPIIMIP